jgi:hypothetical protein
VDLAEVCERDLGITLAWSSSGHHTSVCRRKWTGSAEAAATLVWQRTGQGA